MKKSVRESKGKHMEKSNLSKKRARKDTCIWGAFWLLGPKGPLTPMHA